MKIIKMVLFFSQRQFPSTVFYVPHLIRAHLLFGADGEDKWATKVSNASLRALIMRGIAEVELIRMCHSGGATRRGSLDLKHALTPNTGEGISVTVTHFVRDKRYYCQRDNIA